MELEQAIRTRRSIRRFQDRDVPTELILKAISLAIWAPNPRNDEAWRFIIIKNRDLIGRMADVAQEHADYVAALPEAEAFGNAMKGFARGAAAFRGASAVIAVTIGPVQTIADKVLEKRGTGDPRARAMIEDRAAVNSRIQTVSAVVDHLGLALHSLGLGSYWGTGCMMAKRELERLIGIPEGHELFVLVPVGYPAETPTPGPRKPLEELVRIVD